MGREAVRGADLARGTDPVAPRFTLWDGGRGEGRDASDASEASGDGALAMALEASPLFHQPVGSTATREGSSDAGTADPDSAPPVERPERPGRRCEGADAGYAGTPIPGIGALDWRLVASSLLLILSMALGAIAARGAAFDAAYESLTWEAHRVLAGETIVSILAGRDLPDVGLGRLVDWVEERNGLPDATIVPGQTLSIPR